MIGRQRKTLVVCIPCHNKDTSRDNRLNMLVESRVRREVQARFGGEFLKPTVEIRQEHRVLAYGSQRSTSCCSSSQELLGVFVCFAGMYMSGVPQGFCILFALAAGLAVTGGTFYLSRRFGPYDFKAHGLAPASAAHHPSSGHPAAATHSYPSNRKTVILCAEP